MQFVEIAREIDKKNLKLLILDEPTAVLTESEAEGFLKVIKRLSEMGIAILFITHRLEEIKQISDNITVLRDGGEKVAQSATKDISTVEMAKAMVGRDIELTSAQRNEFSEDAPNILEIQDLVVDMPGERVRGGIDMKVKRERYLESVGWQVKAR